MKKIYKLYIGILLSTITVSCTDNLDSDKYFNDRRSLEDVFTDKTSTEEWLVHAYSFLGGQNLEVSTKDNILWNFADDIYFGGNSLGDYRKFKTGTYDENWYHSWDASYKGIRQASIFIQNIDMNTEFTETERADLKAQARFVRAYYYWLLLRRYGPVPLLPDEGLDYTNSYDDLAIQRSSYDECVEYIESEMRLAAQDLPLVRAINQIARPTRGAALAARARALLYAASPINNPRPGDTEKFTDLVDYDGRCLISQEYNEYKWARAAAAARDIMELPGDNNGHRYELYHKKATSISELGYPATIAPYQDHDFSEKTWDQGGYSDIDPYESYRAVFNGALAMYQNPELIFGRGRNQGANSLTVMVQRQMPKSLGGGDNTYGMTLKMCDAYYMVDGKDFSREQFKEEYPSGKRFVTKAEADAGTYPHLKEGVYKEYANREPRFYASVSFNGCVWSLLKNAETVDYKKDVEKQVNYYYGINTDGFSGIGLYLRSGIGIMKYVHPDDTNRKEIKAKPETAIRFAEILLIYAEALNELEEGTNYNIASWDGSTTYSIKRDIDEMKKGIRQVRRRAGVPDYDLETVYKNQEELRRRLKKERQIELMGEGQRYFDLRRWKDAEVEESKKNYGCNFYMSDSKDQKEHFYTPIEVADLPTAFSRKLYFWPIGHEELKRNKRLTQNPGWTYND